MSNNIVGHRPEAQLIQLDGDSSADVRPSQDLRQEAECPSEVLPTSSAVSASVGEATVMLCSPASFASGHESSGSGNRFGIESAARQQYELDRL